LLQTFKFLYFYNLNNYFLSINNKKKNYNKLFFNIINKFYNFEENNMNMYNVCSYSDIITFFMTKIEIKSILNNVFKQK